MDSYWRHFSLFFVVLFLSIVLPRDGIAVDKKDLVVVVSIKPLHSLVAKVMERVGAPHLLLKGAISPHDFQLKPSDVSLVSKADLFIRVGSNLETGLNNPLSNLLNKTKVLNVIEGQNIQLLSYRDVESEEHHNEKHKGHHHEEHGHKHSHGGKDPHIWLSLKNAKAITQMIGQKLMILDPANKSVYTQNIKQVLREIAVQEKDIKTLLTPLKGKTYMVFHDAYQYLTDGYGLHYAGAVSVPSTAHQPSAKHILKLRKALKRENVVCVFSEPQFSPKLVKTIIEGVSVKTAVLDPIGLDIPAGKDAYITLIQRLVKKMSACLSD